MPYAVCRMPYLLMVSAILADYPAALAVSIVVDAKFGSGNFMGVFLFGSKWRLLKQLMPF